ncbi:MAG: autotransporter domain-containing protein [Hyphomicrobium sp.]
MDAGAAALLIRANAGSATINNAGTVTGDIVVHGGSGSGFNNLAGGVFNSGKSAFLNYTGTLTNAGTVSPGGDGAIKQTALYGHYVQTSTGVLKIDADWTGNAGAGSSDQLQVIGSFIGGGTAVLAGRVVVNALNFPESNSANKGLTKTFQDIITSTYTVTDNGLVVTDTAAAGYTLLVGAKDVDLKAVIDFTPTGVGLTGLTLNQTAVGTTLNEIVGDGGSPGFVPALLTVPTQAGLASALDQLAPQGDGCAFSSAFSTGATFGGQLLSCRTAGEQGDANAFIHEGQCIWARANARRLENDGGANKVGFEEAATFFSGGAQIDAGGPWRIGAGIGIEDTNLKTASNASSEGDRLHLGAVLKYNPGPWLLAASVTGGKGWTDNERSVSFGGFSATAKSDTDTNFFGGRFTAAYLASFGTWYLKPQIDVAATHLSRDGYSESASGGIALNVNGSDGTVVAVSPVLELGSQFAIAGGGIARPYVKGGVTWLDTNEFITTASFADAAGGVAPFSITTEIDDVVADVGAGVDFIGASGTVLRLQYDGQFGEETTQHGGAAKLSVPF